jgi:hypothetical protein
MVFEQMYGSATYIFILAVIYSVTLPRTKDLEENWFPQLAPILKLVSEYENKRRYSWVST